MAKLKPIIISIIIRTKNEEKWIGRCLESISSQKIGAEIEVILVDNESTDHTIEVAKRYPVSKFINITKFLPGKALNKGIRVSTGDYIVCISAHCIPEKEDWLENMLSNFKDNSDIAGVYGRQIPLSFTEPIDKRDLLIVFGLDKRVQEKDYFFHNANSMVPRSVWEKFPFDEQVSNIEDRVWGKDVIGAGYKIIYEPEAAVYHHHGLHQGNTEERAKGVVSILESVESLTMNSLPLAMTPERINVAAVIPIMGEFSEESEQAHQFKKAVHELKNSRFVKSIYCLAQNKTLAESADVKYLDRNSIKNADSLSLNKLLKETLDQIESRNDFPDSILYVNYDYIHRPEDIFNKLITDAQHKGCDTLFPGLIDYGHYWYHTEEQGYMQTDPSLKPRANRDPLYKALYGQGCLSAAWTIRKSQMVGGKVGILKLSDSKYVQRITK